MVIFPWKQKIVGQSIQRCSAKKSGQPLDKNSWSARAATVSNLQQKIKTKVWSCSRKLSTRAEEGVYWFARPPLQTCSALSQFYSNKNQKIYEQFLNKTVDPERRFVLPENTKHVGISSSRPQRGTARHFLSTEQPFPRWVPGKQREDEHHHTKPGGGAARRGSWRRSKGLLRGLWVLELWQKIISWRFT